METFSVSLTNRQELNQNQVSICISVGIMIGNGTGTGTGIGTSISSNQKLMTLKGLTLVQWWGFSLFGCNVGRAFSRARSLDRIFVRIWA